MWDVGWTGLEGLQGWEAPCAQTTSEWLGWEGGGVSKGFRLGAWLDVGWVWLPTGLAGWPCTNAGRGDLA